MYFMILGWVVVVVRKVVENVLCLSFRVRCNGW